MQQPPAFLQHLEHFNPQMLNVTQEQVTAPTTVLTLAVVHSIYVVHVLPVPSASEWAAPGFCFATEPKLPRHDATDGPRSPRAAPARSCGAARLPRGVPPPSATGDCATPCETKRVQPFPN